MLGIDMASEVLCGKCGALLTNPNAPCPRCGSAASGRYQGPVARTRKSPLVAAALAVVAGLQHRRRLPVRTPAGGRSRLQRPLGLPALPGHGLAATLRPGGGFALGRSLQRPLNPSLNRAQAALCLL